MRYRIHRIKEAPGEHFRWAAHTGGLAIVKAKDYDVGEEIESTSPYAAWTQLREAKMPLHPGDLLESLSASGQTIPLLIAKYIGFEPAEWFMPAAKPGTERESEQEFTVEAAFIPPTA